MSLPRVKPGFLLSYRACFCLGAPQVHVRCHLSSGTLCTGQCCAQRLCWKGTARHLKDILRLCSVVPDFQAEQLVYVVYSDCSLGSAGF